jgi:hypothetical protein
VADEINGPGDYECAPLQNSTNMTVTVRNPLRIGLTRHTVHAWASTGRTFSSLALWQDVDTAKSVSRNYEKQVRSNARSAQNNWLETLPRLSSSSARVGGVYGTPKRMVVAHMRMCGLERACHG